MLGKEEELLGLGTRELGTREEMLGKKEKELGKEEDEEELGKEKGLLGKAKEGEGLREEENIYSPPSVIDIIIPDNNYIDIPPSVTDIPSSTFDAQDSHSQVPDNPELGVTFYLTQQRASKEGVIVSSSSSFSSSSSSKDGVVESKEFKEKESSLVERVKISRSRESIDNDSRESNNANSLVMSQLQEQEKEKEKIPDPREVTAGAGEGICLNEKWGVDDEILNICLKNEAGGGAFSGGGGAPAGNNRGTNTNNDATSSEEKGFGGCYDRDRDRELLFPLMKSATNRIHEIQNLLHTYETEHPEAFLEDKKDHNDKDHDSRRSNSIATNSARRGPRGFNLNKMKEEAARKALLFGGEDANDANDAVLRASVGGKIRTRNYGTSNEESFRANHERALARASSESCRPSFSKVLHILASPLESKSIWTLMGSKSIRVQIRLLLVFVLLTFFKCYHSY